MPTLGQQEVSAPSWGNLPSPSNLYSCPTRHLVPGWEGHYQHGVCRKPANPCLVSPSRPTPSHPPFGWLLLPLRYFHTSRNRPILAYSERYQIWAIKEDRKCINNSARSEPFGERSRERLVPFAGVARINWSCARVRPANRPGCLRAARHASIREAWTKILERSCGCSRQNRSDRT
jgi:hypothetical protein